LTIEERNEWKKLRKEGEIEKMKKVETSKIRVHEECGRDKEEETGDTIEM
jgi:hypothetical protein